MDTALLHMLVNEWRQHAEWFDNDGLSHAAVVSRTRANELEAVLRTMESREGLLR